jgi:uncharacterized protein (TIGR02217 family)
MFLESPRFPDNISIGVSFGPEFVTVIATNPAGYEYRNRVRVKALSKGDCTHSVKTKAQYDELVKFFRSVGGRFHGFRFKDWSDYHLKHADSVLALSPNFADTYQLFKKYEVATGFSELRTISKPVQGTVSVLFEGTVPILEGPGTGEFGMDYTTGEIVFGTAIAGITGITVACEFDVPARFDTDHMPAVLTHPDVFDWGQIPILEIRV